MPMPPKQPIGRPVKRPSFWERITQRVGKKRRDVLQTPGANVNAQRMRKKQGL